MCLSLGVMFLHRQPFSPILSLLWQVQFWRSRQTPFLYCAALLTCRCQRFQFCTKPKMHKERSNQFYNLSLTFHFFIICLQNKSFFLVFRTEVGLWFQSALCCTDCSDFWDSCPRGFLSYIFETSTLELAHVCNKKSIECLAEESVWVLRPSS